ncbi:MAG TPA: hypothetical protein VFI03_09080 [Solirubrobacterales bacterium]|nr:hypothetical protein [Solirubrobacterales bacterium]
MGRTWVPAVGIVAGLVFVLTQLTGSDVDEQAAQTIGTALAVVLFTIFGTAGIALVRWQPRFAPLGVATAMLSLLACGATVALTWTGEPSFFFLIFGGTSGTVAGITDLLALTGATTCVLLATIRPGEDAGSRLSRVASAGALVLFIALAILAIVDHSIDIGPKVYAILATVFVVATAILLVLRLLPLPEDSQAAS